MNMQTIRWKFIALWVGVAVVAGVAIYMIATFAFPPGNSPNPQGTAETSSTITTTTNGTPSGSSTASTPSHPSAGSGKNIPALPGPAITIHLLTPISGNSWTMGGTNPIAWDKAAGITGEIDLVDAKTKAFIGVILSETGPNQTSYTWDARSIYFARYSADKRDVTPGTYSIRIHFDGNGLGNLISGPVTISK